MTLLILCVDRDNDLGTKVGLEGPIIGREACLNAAIGLGIKDPEDSDTNSILSGVSIYDKYHSKDVDVEIAILCGDSDVGIVSDTAISSQLNDVISKVKPKSAILVSDGAEDEYIYPILSSRIEIDGIKRVVVRQAKNAENLYYLIAKLLHDEKVRKKFIVPLSLALIVFSSLAILTILMNPIYQGLALPAAILTLGVYIIVKSFNWDQSLKELSQDMKTIVTTVPFLILAGTVMLLGFFQAFNAWYNMEKYDILYRYLVVAGILIWAGVFAAILAGTGRALQLYTRGTEFPRVYFPIVLSLLAFASLSYGITYLLSFLLDIIPEQEESQIATKTIIFIATGVFFATLSYLSHVNTKTSTSDWHQ